METKVRDRKALLEAELARFVEITAREFDVEKIILFGSLARALDGDEGALGEWSDLDLVVVAETEEPFYERMKRLKRRVRPKVGADTLVYTPGEWEQMRAERSFVRNEMVNKGRVVYERADR